MVIAYGTRLFLVDLIHALRWLTLHDLKAAQSIGDAAYQPVEQPRPITVTPAGMKRLEAHQDALECIGLRYTMLTPTSVLLNSLPGPIDPERGTSALLAAADIKTSDAVNEAHQAALERAVAFASIQEVPKLSRYDLRTICASLDEVAYYPAWGVPNFIVEVKVRP